MSRIEDKAKTLDAAVEVFRKQQTQLDGTVTHEDKAELRRRFLDLETELNDYLSGEYGIKKSGASSPTTGALAGLPAGAEWKRHRKPSSGCPTTLKVRSSRQGAAKSIELRPRPGIFSRPVMNDDYAIGARLSARPPPPSWPRQR